MRGYRRPRERTQPVGPPVAVPGRLYGLRKWSVQFDATGRLRLVGHGLNQWRADGETTWAECHTGRGSHPPDARAPVGGCSCGLYVLHPWAVRGSAWEIEPSPDDLEVAGIVEAWGRVHVHRDGFRAQYARPVTLVTLGFKRDSDYGRMVESLALGHRTKLLELERVCELVAYCRHAGLGLPRSAVDALITEPDPENARADLTGWAKREPG